ncbi:MAG TPA: PEP-CTERM sorting domain-containing protein [Rhizomicrobium sp.]|nr:PEP-CTERM sorting domain-containing protein [Rhizomicrobium sp.]
MHLRGRYQYRAVLGGVLISAALGLCAAPASAACVNSPTVFCDATKVQAYNGASPNNYGGPGFVPPGVGDVLQSGGNLFDTDRVNVKVTSSAGTTSLELKYYTQFNGSSVGARYADVFLGNNLASPDHFQYGIALGNQSSNGGLGSPGLYDLASAGSYETSIQIWSSRTSFIYGGQFQGLDGLWHDSPTVVTPLANPLNAWSVNVAEGASGDAQYPYLVDITLMASNLDFATLFGNGLSVFWGTGDCSNDAIEMALPPVQLPEPVSLGLFAAGLAGMAGLRRRKSNPARA